MNTKKHFLWLVASLCLLFGTLRAADVDSNIQPSVDVAQFFDANSNTSYLEIYYAIPEAGVMYIPGERGQYHCQLVLDIQISLNEKLWTNKVWKIEKTVEDTSLVNAGSQLVDVLRYFIDEYGDYNISMHVKDMHRPDRIDSVSVAFTALKFSKDRIQISDVELASHIQRVAGVSESNLIKNNYKVVPSPGGMFGQASSNIYYYFEAYNLLEHIPGDKYFAVCRVLNPSGNEVEGVGLTYRTKKKLYDSSMEIGMVNVANLPSGKYKLVYGLADASKTMLANKNKIFYVYNPQIQVVDEFRDSRFGTLDGLTEEELDEEFKRMIFINTKHDREFYSDLKTADGKQKFIIEIWSRPNEDVLPPEMFREQYLGRSTYASDKYKSVFSKGWKSDRGRVFVLYGAPSDVERFPSTESAIPYQVWQYDKLRGQARVQFVFADMQGFSKYELLHSSLRGERNNPDWKSYVFRGSSEKQFR